MSEEKELVTEGKSENSPSESKQRKEWDHSNRRVMVTNVFRYDDSKRMKKASQGWTDALKEKGIGIVIERIRKVPKEGWSIVTLEKSEMVQPLVDYINQTPSVVNRKGGKLHANPAGDGENKRKDEDQIDRSDLKRQRIEDEKKRSRRPVSEEEIKDRVTPLWKLSDQEQVVKKTREMIKKCAMKVISETKSRFR